MARRGRDPWGGWNALLALVAIVAFVWGLERWRRDAAQRAGRSERARVVALARCLLGPDGDTVMRLPATSRRRLRALAMDTATEASVTWLDRCVPTARALARHAGEVDNSGALTAAQTRVAERTRALAEAVSSTALVWRIRSGDPDADMDLVAESLARAASEIDLAGAPQDTRTDAGAGVPVAPTARTLREGQRVATVGLEPTVLGDPSRFLAGAPLPAAAEIYRDEQGIWRVDTLANEPSTMWRADGDALVRVDATFERTEDGLAPMRVFRAGEEVAEARITPVNDVLDGARVSLDATVAGTTIWLAQWTPWNGTVLARFVPSRPATALELTPAATRVDPRTDEQVAVASLGAGALVAFTQQRDEHTSTLSLATTRGDRDRAPVERIASREIRAEAPGLEFCPRSDGSQLLFVAGARTWLALRIDPAGLVSELAHVEPERGRVFDERLAVHCAPGGAAVAWGREHTRTSPLLVCTGEPTSPCARAPIANVPLPAQLPIYATRTPTGRALAHAEWPMAFALAGSTLVGARSVGGVVSVARMAASGVVWGDEHVVFDAAARAHGETVVGLGLYAHGNDVTLAAGAADGLHVFSSRDAGAAFE